jgi:type VI secretion system secreted protein VgrG
MGELESVAFRFEASAFPIEVRVLDFEASEALDEPYVAIVDVAIQDASADPLELLGLDCALVITREPLERRFAGIVRAVWEPDGRPDDVRTPDVVRARLEVVPGMFMLSLRRNTRMFQEKTVPEILEAVLGESLGVYGRSAQLELEATYPRREYCLQYQESDLDFVQRLMEEEGIHYAFDHQGEVETLVLRDSNNAFAMVETMRLPIELQPNNLHARDREVVHAFLRRHTHAPTSVVLREMDWTASSTVVEDEERSTDAKGRDRESYEHGQGRSVTLWDYSQPRYAANDAARQKLVRLEAHAAETLVGHGVGRVIGFKPGMKFDLMGHSAIGFDGEYAITRVLHFSQPAEARLGTPAGGGVEDYHNVFECIPIAVPHRPKRRTPKPRIAGIQTAIVTGPSGEEIHTDEHGRIKVQFHWDRENPADDTSSCWVRCEQAWAHAGWGFTWIPRIGMEVVVHFRDGDPDRPLVTGCVYNGTNPTPYTLPDEKTKSTIKSNSSPGGGGSNELRFEDKAGSEEIYGHAQKDYEEVVLNDHTTTVHHDQTNEVDNDQTQTIGSNQTETVHGNQDMSVGGNRDVHVKGNFDETVDGTETRHTAGAVTETFSATEARTVGGNLTETVSGSESRTISGNKTESITGNHTLTVSASSTRSITGSLTLDATGGITESTPAAYSITATGGMNVTTTGPTNWTAPGGIKLMAPGGVTWIDSGDDWFGKHIIEYAPTKYEDFCVKLEACDVALTVVALIKCEQAGFEMGNEGSKNWISGSKMVAAGIRAAAGALQKRRTALTSSGG